MKILNNLAYLIKLIPIFSVLVFCDLSMGGTNPDSKSETYFERSISVEKTLDLEEFGVRGAMAFKQLNSDKALAVVLDKTTGTRKLIQFLKNQSKTIQIGRRELSLVYGGAKDGEVVMRIPVSVLGNINREVSSYFEYDKTIPFGEEFFVTKGISVIFSKSGEGVIAEIKDARSKKVFYRREIIKEGGCVSPYDEAIGLRSIQVKEIKEKDVLICHRKLFD